MKQEDRAGMLDARFLKRKADIFKALSAPARVAIVEALYNHPMNVTELIQVLSGLDCDCSMERTNVSKHLAVLRSVGIISSTGKAQQRIYRLEKPCLAETLDCCGGPDWSPVTRTRPPREREQLL